MADLQELISRARFIFSGAPKRFDVYNLINGKRSTKDISKKTGRSLSSVLQDIEKLKDLELIQERQFKNGFLKKDGASVFEKTPIIKHVSKSYFRDVSSTSKLSKKRISKISRSQDLSSIHIPSEGEILDICKEGEDQLYEFKSPGTKMEDISEEIAAFLHTKSGGILFYGIDDNGTVLGSDIRRQDFDQRIHNSIRNTINPSPTIDIKESHVMGAKIILVVIPSWDRQSLYQYTKKGRYLIRRGTNKFAIQPDELKKLSKGVYVV
jgi:DNA-binding Lrp family transcriptional regulator